MSKCAVCNKTAYPLESLKALEVVYHKLCFKCDVCKTTLNLKNFKGLNGKIYCAVHTPVDRKTAGADAVSVKAALNAPKKVAEGLSTAHKGDKITAVGAAGEVIRSTDAVPSSGDQSTSYEPDASHSRPQDQPGYNSGYIAGAAGGEEPQYEEEQPQYEEEQPQYEEEAQYEEEDY